LRDIRSFERDIPFCKDLVRGRSKPPETTFDLYKAPKPDGTFALPIYVNDVRNHDTYTDDGIFAFANLAKLEGIGIYSSPRFRLKETLEEASFWGGEAKNPVGKNAKFRTDGRLQCYPWGIIEVKKPGASKQDEVKCYCQALNSCSAALELLERLYKVDEIGSIPPIVAFTFIGPKTKVWLAYSELLKGSTETHRVRSSFSQSIVLTSG
jgi:hypothetical protein